MAKKVRLSGVNRFVKVRVASTANLAVASAVVNGATVDGVVLATGDRILLKNQTTPAENGVYIVAASGAASRASDWAAGDSVVSFGVRVYNGTAGANTVWAVYAEPAIVGTNDPQLIQHERMGA
jgi:FAD synthase